MELAVVVALFAALAALLLALWLWPTVFARLLMRLSGRLRVGGLENVPQQGGALLVCTPLPGRGVIFLIAALRRPFALVGTHRPAFPGLARLLLRDVKFITQADVPAALRAGELVCLIAEGRAEGDRVVRFHEAMGAALDGAGDVPIVPVSLLWRLPRVFGYPVGVTFGAPLPATTSAAEVRLTLQKLSADSARARVGELRPVHRQFVRTAARHPFRSCLFDSLRPEGLSYGRALAGAICVAGWLRHRLGTEAMVATWLPPSVGGVLTNVALALLGKTSVNLNYTAGPDAIQSALRQCAIRHVITSRRFTARLKLETGPGIEVIYLEDVAPQISAVRRTLVFLMVLLLPGWVIERVVLGLGGHTADDLATVIFSSGSTGEPKGIMLTHGNVASNALACIEYLNIGPQDRVLGILPFFHSFGYTVTLWTPLQVGASTVYFPDPRAAKEIGELCKKYRCTIFLTTPTFLRFCVRRCETDDFRSLHLLVCGAEKLPPSLAQEFAARFELLPLEGYGCTELSPVVAANIPDRVSEEGRSVHNKSGSIGEPVPGVAVRVVNPENEAEVLPPGQEGLLQVTGPNVMKGYLHKEELTRRAVRDGWYTTGDMARIDEDGFIFLTGRLSRFAKVGGEMVPLEKVEEELQVLLGTSERMLAVTCVPDEGRGERLVVLYTALEGQDVRQLGRSLAAKGLPNLWLPAERDYHRVAELPILGSGKLDLKRLQEMALEVTGASRGRGPHLSTEAPARPTRAAP